jgi:hypothetical protein
VCVYTPTSKHLVTIKTSSTGESTVYFTTSKSVETRESTYTSPLPHLLFYTYSNTPILTLPQTTADKVVDDKVADDDKVPMLHVSFVPDSTSTHTHLLFNTPTFTRLLLHVCSCTSARLILHTYSLTRPNLHTYFVRMGQFRPEPVVGTHTSPSVSGGGAGS